MLQEARRPLGSRPFVHAEMYKKLLYEQGAHFEPHRDSEKAPGTFATLAICLPSLFEGGELLLEPGDEKFPWDSAKMSLTNVSVAAWWVRCSTYLSHCCLADCRRYADVTHGVKPVVSGHRLVLT